MVSFNKKEPNLLHPFYHKIFLSMIPLFYPTQTAYIYIYFFFFWELKDIYNYISQQKPKQVDWNI